MTFNRMVPQPTMTPEEVAAWRRWRETARCADAVEARSLLAEALAVASAGFADGEGEPS